MKTYTQINENAEYREVYDSYRHTVDNLNSTDFLYKTMLSNGQVFFEGDEVYGFVNEEAALRNHNIEIPRSLIDDFKITNFILYTRVGVNGDEGNDLITLNINCNLANYWDNKVHYLYVVLDHNGTYEVHDDMFQSDETKILFARFIIDQYGNSRQFYMMLPFAGSADYLKGNQFYQVTDGLRVEIMSPNVRQLTLTDAKIRFSGINFDDKSSPDCIELKFTDDNDDPVPVPIRYVYWNPGTTEDGREIKVRTNWEGTAGYNLIIDKYMDYSTGTISNVASGKFTIQKFYFDVYERCIVALYGDTVYNTRDEAILSIDSIMNYPLPDGIEYLIPIACIVMQNTSDPIDLDTNFRIVNLDYNEKEVLDSDTFTRQQAAEAINNSRQAIAETQAMRSDLNSHTQNTSNPHQVRLDQLYDSTGQPCVIDNSFAEAGLSVTGLINRTIAQADLKYLPLAGGTVTGNVIVSQTLTVNGKTTLADVDTGAIKLASNKNITFTGNTDIGTNNNPANYTYTKNLSVSSTAYMKAINSDTITPNDNGSYNLGSTNARWGTGYFNNISVSTKITGGDGAFTKISASGLISANGGLDMGWGTKLTVYNGYLLVGGYSLVLGANINDGGSYSIPTTNGYGIW